METSKRKKEKKRSNNKAKLTQARTDKLIGHIDEGLGGV
jgi:hypothetical protein